MTSTFVILSSCPEAAHRRTHDFSQCALLKIARPSLHLFEALRQRWRVWRLRLPALRRLLNDCVAIVTKHFPISPKGPLSCR